MDFVQTTDATEEASYHQQIAAVNQASRPPMMRVKVIWQTEPSVICMYKPSMQTPDSFETQAYIAKIFNVKHQYPYNSSLQNTYIL